MIRILKSGIASLGIGLLLIYTLFPFYWAINSSLKSGSELFESSPWPKNPAWHHYSDLFVQQPFALNILNSILVASTCVIFSLAIGLLAAYPLAKHEFRGRKLLLVSVLGISMFPQIAVLSGLFELIRILGLYNHWLGLSISYLLFTLPFTIWVLQSFLKQIPRQLEEAAIMDGAGPFTILTRILLPVMAPATITTGLLAFIFAWNEFLFALTFTLSDESRTVPVAIALMSGSSQYELPWAKIMTGSVIVTVPLVILVLVFQRRIVSGLTAGAVK